MIPMENSGMNFWSKMFIVVECPDVRAQEGVYNADHSSPTI